MIRALRTLAHILAIGTALASLSCGLFERLQQNSNVEPDIVQTDTATPTSPHLAFGIPSNATQDLANSDNYLIVGDGSVFSYNNSRGSANWVSWKTTRSDLGKAIERPDFRPDPRLPSHFVRIGYYDYSGSGYDRGHLVPSADRFTNPRLNEETFMMSNIVPQTAALNQYPWNKLEQYARKQAWRFDVYQIAGVYGEQNRLKGKVTAPTNCWKIIMLVRRGEPVEKIDSRTRVVAVDMPNVDGIENVDWQRFRTSVREIELKTSYNFFAALPADLQEKLETRTEVLLR